MTNKLEVVLRIARALAETDETWVRPDEGWTNKQLSDSGLIEQAYKLLDHLGPEFMVVSTKSWNEAEMTIDSLVEVIYESEQRLS
jgi:hypothetical protein